jgi:hypothetical protein
VATYRIFEKHAFSPEDVKRLGDAYEAALVELRIANRSDPITEMIAEYIIESGQTGERDPGRICALAVERVKNGN